MHLPFIINVIAVRIVLVLLAYERCESTRGVFKKVATPREEYRVSVASCEECWYVVVTHFFYYLVGVIVGCAWEIAFLIEQHLCPGGKIEFSFNLQGRWCPLVCIAK